MASAEGGPVPQAAQAAADLQPNQQGGARKRASTPVPRVQKHVFNVGSTTSTATKDTAGQRVGVENLSDRVLRAGFLRKVYGILSAQMMLTVSVAAACTCIKPVQSAFLEMFHSHSRAVQFAIFIPTLLSLLSLQLGAKRHFPSNYILLFVFTLSQAINVGYVCTVYEAAGLGHLILMAFAITAVIFLVLTLYTLHAGKDMSYMRGFLFTALTSLVLASLVAVFVPQLRESLVFAVLGALTFCGYIVYDTWRIEKQFGYDDYIPATIELYLDIINLFLNILKILGYFEKKSNKKK